MTQSAWSRVAEPASAVAMKQERMAFDDADASFWTRDDLTYLGDLTWCEQAAMKGFEYIANIQISADQITYRYGLINLDGADGFAGSLVCNVRAQRTDGYPFEMQINGEWLEGPLRFWLDQLSPSVQELARQRYRAVIAWAEAQLD
jgi:hypothetical protein